MTILDENFAEITDYAMLGSNGKRYAYHSEYGSSYTDDFFEMNQGEVYYIMYASNWSSYSDGVYAFDQTRYTITLDSGLQELQYATYASDLRLGDEIQGSSLWWKAVRGNNPLWEEPEDLALMGFIDENGNYISNTSRDLYEVTDNACLDAVWMEETDIVTDAYLANEWCDGADGYVQFDHLLDEDLELSVNDAVDFYFMDGDVLSGPYEALVTDITDYEGGEHYDTIGSDYSDVYVYFDYVPDWYDFNDLFFISVKREFDVTLSYNNLGAMDPGDAYIEAVPKAGGFDFPTFEYHEDVADGYYFAGWSEDVSATSAKYLDGGHADPIRDTTYYAIFRPTASSNVVSLGENIDGFGFKFVINGDDDKEYIELQILDPNLTITYSGSATTITLIDKDGNTKSAAIVAMKGSSWGDLTTATRASGTIRIRLSVNSVSHDDIAKAVQLVVA